MRKRNLKFLRIVIVVLSFFILDRLLKIWFFSQPTKKFRFLFFQLSLYKNDKIFFGLIPFNFLTIIFSLVILFYLVYWLFCFWRQSQFFSFFAGSLIFVGAFSNLIDRFRYGFVIDYLAWPLNFFNLADLMILVGVIILAIELIFKEK